jgi:uncharacterized protein YkwD
MLRIAARLLIPFAILFALAASPGSAGRTAHASKLERLPTFDQQLLGQINALRARHGLSTLHLSARLSAAAAQHSDQMTRRGYFAHQSADGTTMGDRVGHFYGSHGYRYWAVGENLLWSSPSISASGSLSLWFGSPQHRANLLSGEWREIGLAAVHATSAPGVFGGSRVTVVTADFGVRR